MKTFENREIKPSRISALSPKPQIYWRIQYTSTVKLKSCEKRQIYWFYKNTQRIKCEHGVSTFKVQWNLVIKRSDITKHSYNKVILLVLGLYISLFFYPDIMRNLI